MKEFLKIFVVIMLVIFVMRAYALKPVSVPQAIQDEATNVQILHKGHCPRNGTPTLCMVGVDPETETFWFLYFNDEGVLITIVTVKDEKETTRWTHPNSSI